MPRRNGTGPYGQGPGTGKGMGGRGGRGGRPGRMGGNRPGAGPAGACICPNCGATIAHQAGVPCYQMSCPQCKTQMVRR